MRDFHDWMGFLEAQAQQVGVGGPPPGGPGTGVPVIPGGGAHQQASAVSPPAHKEPLPPLVQRGLDMLLKGLDNLNQMRPEKVQQILDQVVQELSDKTSLTPSKLGTMVRDAAKQPVPQAPTDVQQPAQPAPAPAPQQPMG